MPDPEALGQVHREVIKFSREDEVHLVRRRKIGSPAVSVGLAVRQTAHDWRSESTGLPSEAKGRRAAVRRGEVALGTMVFEFASPGLPAILATTGADFAIYDMEHTGLSLETVRALMAWSRGTATVPLVRVPSIDPQFQWNVCVFPAGRAGRFSATGGTQGSSWLILAATSNKNEAWAFARFLAGEEMQQRITRSGLIGARKSAAATARQLNAGQPPASWGMFLDGEPVTRAVPHVAKWAEFDAAYGAEVGRVIAGQAAPREAGARLKEQLEPLLTGP